MKRTRWITAVGVTTLVTLALTACSGGGSSSSSVKQDSKAGITVWVDDTRSAPAKAYAKAHPDLKATITTVANGPGDEPSKIALATKAGKGVPDVVFLSQPDEISSLLANPVNYPLALNGVASAKVLDGFAKGTTTRCTFGGKVYCLPNDIAQTVLFYNKTLFTQFGYTVPTTFDDWLALSRRVAAEHPGYSLGSVNGRYGLDAYFGSSQCDVNTSTDPTKVTIDTTSTKCTRVADVIGPMLANGTLSTLDPFDKAYTPVVTGGKLLATISPTWMAQYGIKPNYPTKGDWAAAPMPTWSGAGENYSGAVGGGLWVVGAKSANRAAALKFAEAMSTDVSVQKTSPGYPADTASAASWLKAVSSDDWYAADPSSVYADAAGKISPTLGYVRYEAQLDDIFNNTVIKNGAGDISGAVKDLGTQAASAASAAGYTVTQ